VFPVPEEGHSPEPAILRLPPERQSVARARARLLELAEQWECPEELVDDARIVLSELMTNGVLHARTDLEVLVSVIRGGGLRLEVHDLSPLPVLPPPQHAEASPGLLYEPGAGEESLEHSSPAATGRGLSIVKALSASWGWHPDAAGGKVVWAELGPASLGGPHRERAHGELEFSGVRPVRLVAVPIRLLKGSEDHFDDLFRELQMARSELAPTADMVRSNVARIREPVRRAIWEATKRGDRLLDLDLLADANLPEIFDATDHLLVGAAKAARQGLLLTEPPPSDVVAWRRWLREELERQIAGRPPRPCPFPVVPEREQDTGPERKKLDLARQSALAELRALLTSAAEPGPDLVGTALRRVVGFIGARRGVICLLGDDNETVVFTSSVGFTPAVMDYWRSYPLSADLPASEAIRTGRPLFFRTFAELDERYPIFLATPAESDPALACVPLSGNGPIALGCLVIGFGQARDFSPRETAFLEKLASEIAAFFIREREAQASTEAGRRERDLRAAGEALRIAKSRDEVLAILVEATATSVVDGCAVHLVDESGGVSFIANRHRDPGRAAAVARFLRKRDQLGEVPRLVRECMRSCRPEVIQVLNDDAMALAARDDEDLEMLRTALPGAVCAVPVMVGRRAMAVLTVANNPGRFVSDADLVALQRLSGAAADALVRLGYDERSAG